MAFLDNSGDIILDAVLTDLGRKRMSEGTFRITQFALGDDEIDYSLYNKDHPSGSAYYDLQILQTPVMEAFATSNANINYGLVSFNGNLNLLYLPSMNAIDLDIATEATSVLRKTGSVYNIAVNAATLESLKTAFATNGEGGAAYVQPGGNMSIAIHMETGISSSTTPAQANPPRTVDLSNQASYIEANNLVDSNFDVHVDTRFVSSVRGLDPAGSKWVLDPAGKANIGLKPANQRSEPAGRGMGLKHYKTAIIRSKLSRIHAPDDQTNVNYLNYSTINGPPGVVAMAHFSPSSDLKTQSSKFSLFGKVGQNLYGDGNTYDYIDTTAYVVGKTTGVQIQIPLRFLRKVVSN
jgi:hypothetical protein